MSSIVQISKYLFKNHLSQFREVNWLMADIENIKEEKDHVVVQTSNGTFQSEYVFSSLYSEQEIVERSRLFIRQHIKSWVIQTTHSSFNPGLNDAVRL